MAFKRCEIKSYNISVDVETKSKEVSLSIWSPLYSEKQPKLIFFTQDSEKPSFWSHDVQGFVANRPRPNSIIGDWNLGRMIAVSFLERFMNVSACGITIPHLITVFEETLWVNVFEHAKLNWYGQM